MKRLEKARSRVSSDGRVALANGGFAFVDPADIPIVRDRCWRRTTGGYADCKYRGRRVTMQEFILGVVPGMQIDHRDRNRLNNRRDNLRHATRNQNAQNADKPKNTVGYRGVKLHRSGRYEARILADSKYKYLGTFYTKEEAADAYNAAALLLHGEFALLNQIGSP